MNTSDVIHKLHLLHPGKNVILNNESAPTEILCEIEPTSEHANYSMAISVIDKSIPHYHKILTEEYKVLKGNLKLHVDNKEYALRPGDMFSVKPNQIHWAEGIETWIECHSTPGWTSQDHILVK